MDTGEHCTQRDHRRLSSTASLIVIHTPFIKQATQHSWPQYILGGLKMKFPSKLSINQNIWFC